MFIMTSKLSQREGNIEPLKGQAKIEKLGKLKEKKTTSLKGIHSREKEET